MVKNFQMKNSRPKKHILYFIHISILYCRIALFVSEGIFSLEKYKNVFTLETTLSKVVVRVVTSAPTKKMEIVFWPLCSGVNQTKLQIVQYDKVDLGSKLSRAKHINVILRKYFTNEWKIEPNHGLSDGEAGIWSSLGFGNPY